MYNLQLSRLQWYSRWNPWQCLYKFNRARLGFRHGRKLADRVKLWKLDYDGQLCIQHAL